MGDCTGSNQGTDASDFTNAGQKMTAPMHKVIFVCCLLSLHRPHCDLAGLFNGNLLFIELSQELYYLSWYIGAMVDVAACHDVDQGSSLHAVNYQNLFF